MQVRMNPPLPSKTGTTGTLALPVPAWRPWADTTIAAPARIVINRCRLGITTVLPRRWPGHRDLRTADRLGEVERLDDLGEMTGARMALAAVDERRLFLRADRLRLPAARPEAA